MDEASADVRPRVGVLMPHRLPPHELVEFGTAVEAAGADDLWIPENLGFVGGYSAAAAVLASTRKIRVGTGISAIPLRHPVAIAMETGTLARAFPGRYVSGLGMGVRGWVEALGRWPRSPLDETRQAARTIAAMLRGESVSASSELYEMTDISIDEGVQSVCPIHVGAVGPAMLRVAAQEADGAILSVLSSPEYVRWARQQLNEADRPAGSTEVVCFANLSVSDAGTGQALAPLRHDTAFLLAAMGRTQLVEALGIGEHLGELLERTGRSGAELARAIPADWIAALSIAGTPQRCAARIHEYLDAGVNTLVLAPKPATEARALLERLPELLALGTARS